MSKRPSKKQSKPQTRAEPPPEAAVEPGKTGRPAEVVEARKRAFLAAFRQTGIVGHAAKVVGVHRDQPRRWRKEDPEFAREYRHALNDAADLLEAEAIRRARAGTDKPVFYKGVPCGKIREYSDTLLIFMLKAIRPKKYRERHEISGPKGGPIRVTNEREIVAKLQADPEAASAMDLIASRLAHNDPIMPGDN